MYPQCRNKNELWHNKLVAVYPFTNCMTIPVDTFMYQFFYTLFNHHPIGSGNIA